MREFTVTYHLDDDDVARLEHLKTLHDRMSDFPTTLESLFDFTMFFGSKFDIKNHLDLAERSYLAALSRLASKGGEIA